MTSLPTLFRSDDAAPAGLTLSSPLTFVRGMFHKSQLKGIAQDLEVALAHDRADKIRWLQNADDTMSAQAAAEQKRLALQNVVAKDEGYAHSTRLMLYENEVHQVVNTLNAIEAEAERAPAGAGEIVKRLAQNFVLSDLQEFGRKLQRG